MTRDKINLFQQRESVKNESETAKVLNKLFYNFQNIRNTNLPQTIQQVLDNRQIYRSQRILKHKSHPSIITIQNNLKGRDVFYFRELKKDEINIIQKLDTNKPSQHSDIATKFIKNTSSDIFVIYAR